MKNNTFTPHHHKAQPPPNMNNEALAMNGERLNITVNIPFIILAEDDIDDQELFTDAVAIHNKDIQIQSVANGKKAINLLENLPDQLLPCLIVLDYNLPEADGAQILSYLSKHERYQAVPKVVWSTSNSHIYREACLKLGAIAYFTKPNDILGIEALAKEILGYCIIK